MDVLSEVLRLVRLSSAAFFTVECSAPWALEFPNREAAANPDHLVSLCILTDGECIVETDAHQTTRIEAGDLMVGPNDGTCIIRSNNRVSPTVLPNLWSSGTEDDLPGVSVGGGGARTRSICGYLNCDRRLSPLVGALPPMLLVRRRNGYATVEAIDGAGRPATAIPPAFGAWLNTTLTFSIDEAKRGRPGNIAVLGRLVELMFVAVVREYLQGLTDTDGVGLSGLTDAYVGPALRLLHTQPTRKWTVDELAHEVALSRSALAQRFTATTGEPPMRHLARWRIQLAKSMMRDGQPIQTVAARVGYESESAFNRTFKRWTGASPAAWRKAALNLCTLWSVLDAECHEFGEVAGQLLSALSAGLALISH